MFPQDLAEINHSARSLAWFQPKSSKGYHACSDYACNAISTSGTDLIYLVPIILIDRTAILEKLIGTDRNLTWKTTTICWLVLLATYLLVTNMVFTGGFFLSCNLRSWIVEQGSGVGILNFRIPCLQQEVTIEANHSNITRFDFYCTLLWLWLQESSINKTLRFSPRIHDLQYLQCDMNNSYHTLSPLRLWSVFDHRDFSKAWS